jgi:hypothetical protein
MFFGHHRHHPHHRRLFTLRFLRCLTSLRKKFFHCPARAALNRKPVGFRHCRLVYNSAAAAFAAIYADG